jgi:hypothetical protein
MTYSQNSNITTTDYATLAGVTNTAAPSAAAATAKAGYLWGIGYGDRGYGQSAPSLTTPAVGSNISQEWQNLRTTINNLAVWQGTGTGIEPPATALNAGADIIAYSSGRSPYDLITLLSQVDANRANYQMGNMALTVSASTSRASAWGGGSTGIQAVFSITFSDEDHARFFFNTGGEIRVALDHPNASTPQDAAWNSGLSAISFAFRSNTTAKISGATGAATGVGYYQITNGYQTIYSGSLAGGAYGTDNYTVEAYSPAIPGINGGRGNLVYIRVTLNDTHTNVFADSVAAGTSASLSYLHANTIAITSPTIALVSGF